MDMAVHFHDDECRLDVQTVEVNCAGVGFDIALLIYGKSVIVDDRQQVTRSAANAWNFQGGNLHGPAGGNL